MARRALDTEKGIRDSLVRALEQVLAELQAGDAPTLSQRLALVVGRTREQALDMARDVVRKVIAMFLSHYPQMDHGALSGGWAPGYEDQEYDEIEAGSVDFADAVVACALKELGL